MSKYSLEFKLKVIHEYCENKSSIQGLVDKYDIPENSLVRTCVNHYEQDGVVALDHKTNKSKFTDEFKLHVIQYRQKISSLIKKWPIFSEPVMQVRLQNGFVPIIEKAWML